MNRYTKCSDPAMKTYRSSSQSGWRRYTSTFALVAYSSTLSLLDSQARAQVPESNPAKRQTSSRSAAEPQIGSPATSLVPSVLRMIKLKISDATILRTIQPKLKGQPLSAEDIVRLAEGGASPALIDALSENAVVDSKPVIPAAQPVTTTQIESTPGQKPTESVLSAYLSDFSTLECTKPVTIRKRVIAISEFDFGAQKSTQQALLQSQNAIGTGMTALAVRRVQDAGKFRVVERKGLESIKIEQDLGTSTRAKQGSSPRLGRIQGADAILMGTIVVFGRDDRKKSVGGGGIVPGMLGALSLGSKEEKAVVIVSYRLVDTETSEVIASGEAKGESLRKSKGIGLAGATGAGGALGGYDMTSSNFQETIIGEATVDCMNKLIAILNSKEGKIRLRQSDLDTRIADISGKQIYISSGAAEGVLRCDTFEVSRIIKELRDPISKEILDLQLEKVGMIMISEVRDKVSVGAFQGQHVPEIGMVVRKVLIKESAQDEVPDPNDGPPKIVPAKK